MTTTRRQLLVRTLYAAGGLALAACAPSSSSVPTTTPSATVAGLKRGGKMTIGNSTDPTSLDNLYSYESAGGKDCARLGSKEPGRHGAQNAGRQFSVGTLSGTTYTNSYFGMTLKFPAAWRPLADQKKKEMADSGAKKLGENIDELANPPRRQRPA